jgi:hypothetical protein
MPRSPRRRYHLIPLLYAAIVLGLFALALFGRGFSRTVGEARVSGRYAPLPLLGRTEARSAEISYHGLGLRFSRGQPLRLAGGEGPGQELRLHSVQPTGSGVDILFGEDTRLTLASAADGSLALTLAARPGQPASATLAVPFRLSSPGRQPEGSAALSWTRRGSTFLLTLPPGSQLDAEAGTLLLSLGSSAGQGLRLARAAEAARGPSLAWLSAEAERATPEELSAATRGFADAAYAAWSGPRLAAGGWRTPAGSVVFDEQTAAALLSESVGRGTYQALRPRVAEAAGAYLRAGPPASALYSVSAYVGGTREYVQRAAAFGREQAERARGLLSRADPSLLETEALVPVLLDHGDAGLAAEAASFAAGRDPGQLSPAAALGALEALLDHALHADRSEQSVRAARAVVDQRLLPALRRTGVGTFMQTAAQDTVDVRLSLRCGSLLARAGAEMDMPLAAAVGRSLLVSALSLRDDGAVLPARLTLAGERIASREGVLLPEAVYGLLPAAGRPLAREVPLEGSLGPGSWILTAAGSVSVESSSAAARLTLSFPAGLPHYAVIQGVRQFTELRMHGIPWRPAPDYAQYSDGYFYDAPARTLYLKLTGRVQAEEITVSY